MAFYRALREGLTVKSPRAWLLAVLRNQISKLERAHRRHGEQLEPHDVMDSFPSEPLGLPEYTADEIQLGDYVAALSKREEEVLMLRLSSLKYREIGEELGITTRAVSTLLARALAKLQTAVKRKQVGLPIPTRTSRDIPKTLH
jgi:RNA polymerase sigma factor (sigma-70 family)